MPDGMIEQWVAGFNLYSPEAVAYVKDKAPSDSFWMYHTIGQHSEGFLSMYQVTGDADYLLPVVDWVESVIGAARPCDSLGGKYAEPDKLGWISQLPAHGLQEIPLYESYAWRFVARLLWLSRHETEPSFRARWRAIRDFTDQHMWSKWYNRGTANLYRSRTHMASHWAVIGMYVAAVSDNPTLRRQADTVARNIMYAGMPSYKGASILGQMSMRSNPADPRAVWFNDVWNSNDLPGSDYTHGEATVSAAYHAWEMGYPGFDDALMSAIARLFRPVIWRRDNTNAYYVDGTGVNPYLFHGGYAKFATFLPELQAELHLSPQLDRASPGNRKPWFIGNAALAHQSRVSRERQAQPAIQWGVPV